MENLQFMILLSLGISSFFLGELEADYGDSCTIYKPCNSSNILDPIRCESDQMKSVCICDFHMFRHIELNRCVSPHNMTCTVHATDGLPLRTCTPFAECVPHALNQSDSQNGTCLCDDDSRHDPVSQQCKFTYGSTRCQKETDCDVLSSLTCRENKCVCQDETFQLFDDKDGKCKSLVGGSCVAEPPLVAPECFGVNMKCDNDGVNATHKCICDSGFVTAPDDDKMCVGIYGASCDNVTSLCNKDNFLVCSDNTCTCRDKYEDDNENGLCRGFLGQPCGAGNDEDCVGNLACKADEGNHYCGCSGRYESSGEMECVGLYGAPCSRTLGCSANRLLSCNPTTNLCDCHDPLRHIYEGGRDACVGRANMECSGAANGTKCVTNASCVGSPPIPTCECHQEYEATEEGRCERVKKDDDDDDDADNSAKHIKASFAFVTFIMIILMAAFQSSYLK